VETPLDYSRLPVLTQKRRWLGIAAAGFSLAVAVATTLWCLHIWSTYLYYSAARHSVRHVLSPLLSVVPALVGFAITGWAVAWRMRSARLAAGAGAVIAFVAWAVTAARLIR
jgi:hypothetical protein